MGAQDPIKGLVLLGNRRAEVRAFPKPTPGPGELLVRVAAAGICGSDLHFYHSSSQDLGQRLGIVIGHEPSGVVEEAGPGVTSFRPGDRITVNHTLGCGHCEYCLAGETVLCVQNLGIAASGYGADAEFILMPARTCFHLPDELSFVEGAFIACTGATAYNALRKLSPSGKDKLAVFGLGPVGLSAVLLAKAFGATVFGVDLLPERLDMAARLGADQVVNATRTDAVEALRGLSGSRGVDLAVETSGSPAGQSDAVDAVCPQGAVAFVGLSRGEKSISPEQFLHKQAILFGSKVMPANLYWEMTRFLIERNLRFEAIVTHRVALDDGPAAFAQFSAGAPGKFVFQMA